jgi:hypothetical protein
VEAALQAARAQPAIIPKSNSWAGMARQVQRINHHPTAASASHDTPPRPPRTAPHAYQVAREAALLEEAFLWCRDRPPAPASLSRCPSQLVPAASLSLLTRACVVGATQNHPLSPPPLVPKPPPPPCLGPGSTKKHASLATLAGAPSGSGSQQSPGGGGSAMMATRVKPAPPPMLVGSSSRASRALKRTVREHPCWVLRSLLNCKGPIEIPVELLGPY